MTHHTCVNPPLHTLARWVGLALWAFYGWRLIRWSVYGLTGSKAGTLLAVALGFWPGLLLVSTLLAGTCQAPRGSRRGPSALMHATLAGFFVARASHE